MDNNSNDVFLEIKAEPTEILYTMQSHHTSLEFPNMYTNKPASPHNTTIISDENVAVATMQNLYTNDETDNTTIHDFAESSSSNFNLMTIIGDDEGLKCNNNCAVVAKMPIKGHKNAENYERDERNHKCPICTKTFKTRKDVNKHTICHSDERKYKCIICTKSFKTKSHMVDHMTCHTGERNYKCDICTKRFRKKCDALEHMRSHTNERNHKCDICGKGFKTRNSLQGHMKRHTNEKNHQCDICMKRFRRKSYVSMHRKRHSNEINHKCGICKKKFKTAMFDCGVVLIHKCDLKNYIDRHEGINVEGLRQKVPRNVRCDVGVEQNKMNIKEENLEIEVPNDIMESKPSMDIKENYFLAAIKEEKTKSTETINSCHTHSGETGIKEENVIGKQITKYVINVKQEI